MSQVRSKAFAVTRSSSRTAVQEAVKQAEAKLLSGGRHEDLEPIASVSNMMSARPSLDYEAGGGVTEPLNRGGSGPLVRRSTAGARQATTPLDMLKVHWWVRDSTALREIILGSWTSLLLLFCPLGLWAGYHEWSATYVFVLNFIALVPLALILGDVTEDLALRYGSVIGGLINATFGNVVEVILSIAALLNGLYDVVTASLIGSILSNLLLVAGCSFFFGGLFNRTQKFNASGNQAGSSLLFLASISFLIPTTASMLFTEADAAARAALVLHISHGTAIILLICYLCYLTFQLYTHVDLFTEEGGEEGEEGEEPEQPMMTLFTSVALLTAITVVVAIASEYLTGSIEEFSKQSGLGTPFVSTIILPIAGNACEHMTAVIVATKNKMDLAMGVAVGSGIQIALFAVPLVVVVGWATGHPFTLSFDPFSALVLVLAVSQCNFATSMAKSHWLLGVQLIALYIIIGVAFLYK